MNRDDAKMNKTCKLMPRRTLTDLQLAINYQDGLTLPKQATKSASKMRIKQYKPTRPILETLTPYIEPNQKITKYLRGLAE